MTDNSPACSQIWGSSAAMARVHEGIARIAPTDATALLVGESGSGKELVARAIHEGSDRSAGAFVAVNCGAIPATLIEAELFGHERGSFTGASRLHAGVFERAQRGTLFLDEITEMPPDLQTRLLRVLETHRFYRVGGSIEISSDARIIAASNRNPMDSVRDGKLREDLFYRLAVFPISIPPLRERDDDATEIALKRLAQLNAGAVVKKRLSSQALEFLRDYRWPGNVRELRNVVERGFLLAETDIELAPPLQGLAASSAPAPGVPEVAVAVGTTLEDAERAIIEATLQHLHGNKPRTAQTLGCSLKTLYNKLNSYAQLARVADA
jgi:transcriptional regulator with PAS, ATPase and Fis domain